MYSTCVESKLSQAPYEDYLLRTQIEVLYQDMDVHYEQSKLYSDGWKSVHCVTAGVAVETSRPPVLMFSLEGYTICARRCVLIDFKCAIDWTTAT